MLRAEQGKKEDGGMKPPLHLKKSRLDAGATRKKKMAA